MCLAGAGDLSMDLLRTFSIHRTVNCCNSQEELYNFMGIPLEEGAVDGVMSSRCGVLSGRVMGSTNSSA